MFHCERKRIHILCATKRDKTNMAAKSTKKTSKRTIAITDSQIIVAPKKRNKYWEMVALYGGQGRLYC